jgi:hypothetical protein
MTLKLPSDARECGYRSAGKTVVGVSAQKHSGQNCGGRRHSRKALDGVAEENPQLECDGCGPFAQFQVWNS